MAGIKIKADSKEVKVYENIGDADFCESKTQNYGFKGEIHKDTFPSRNAMGEYIVPPGGKPLTSLGESYPAPSDYNPKVHLTKPDAPHYSISGKPKYRVLNDYNAGPADNDTSNDLIWKNKYLKIKGMGNMCVYDIRDKAHINDSIGPSRYKIENNKVGNNGPMLSISSRQKQGQNAGYPNPLVHPSDTDGFKTPGPNYRPNSGYWGRGPKKSFGMGRTETANKNPGPADYNPKDEPNGISYSLAKRLPPPLAQQQATHTDSPGPGAYSLEILTGKAQAKSISGRPEDPKKQETPAPSHYSLRDTLLDVPTSKLTYRPFEHSEVPCPGPTSYTINNSNLKKAPKYSVGRLIKPSFPDILNFQSLTQKQTTPGPGSYEDKHLTVAKNGAPKYSIGKTAAHIKNDIPGPNLYKININFRPDAKKPPAFSMGSRRDVIDKRVSPGPAAYNLQPPVYKGGYSMTQRPQSNIAFSTPAPNAYSPQEKLTRRGVSTGPSASFKSRASPYVFSGFKTNKVID